MRVGGWADGFFAALRPAVLLLVVMAAATQAQQPTGSIAGGVTDSTGARVEAAEVSIVNLATQFASRVTTNRTGAYTLSGMLPGHYEICVSARGFATGILRLTVEVGRTSNGDVQLRVGTAAESVTVQAEEVRVNSTQSALEGVVTEKLIRDLPLNGRNFLDLGQLEPGVQVVPDDILTRGAFARLSVAGQTGLTTRVTVDGLDIADEHAGSVALNLSPDSIKEFQISRSTFDISTGLTGSGVVNIVTNAGGNDLHGSAFLFWRDDALAARVGQYRTPFDREQFGFSLGGPFKRDRLFWFINYERTNQDAAVVTKIPQFPQFSRTWRSPYDERMAMGRLDWIATSRLRAFLRFTHNWNTGVPGRSFGGVKLAPLKSSNNANQTVAGLDTTAGRFTHSVRFGYTQSDNLGDIARDLPGVPITVDPAGRLLTVLEAGAGGALGGNAILIGTHPNSPNHRYQDTHEVRYDGTFSIGRHALRWGALANIIRINWFDSVFANGPQANLNFSASAIAKCQDDILCYPVQNAVFGNGLGYFTEIPSHGQPYGGVRNNRVHGYVGDSWRVHPRLTLNFGLRWVYEPGPANHDLERPRILDGFLRGLSEGDRLDRNNFAPQVGIAWSPTSSGKWVVRAGAGVFYDVNRLQNVLFSERANLLPLGITLDVLGQVIRDPITNRIIFDIRGRPAPPGESPALITPGCNWVGRPLGSSAIPGSPCNMSLLDALFAAHAAIHAAYQVALDHFPAGPSSCEFLRSCTVVAPDYQTPYSLHFNVGMQRELRPGLVLSVDYVRNRSLHFMMRRDANRTGAADTLDVNRALAAMASVHAARGCDPGPAGVECAIAPGKGQATLATYANAFAGTPASPSGPSTSAFPGLNPQFNDVTLLTMSGFSNYQALQVNLRGQLPNVGRMLRNPSVVASYALGRMEGTAEDQAIINLSDKTDDNHPARFRGPTGLDRTHILGLASLFTIPSGIRLNSIWRVFSALPQTLSVPQSGSTEPYGTDFNGDGNSGDLLPGTNRGSYGRDIGCGSAALNRVIDRYNTTQAGQLTPRGEALVNAGLFTRDQLVRLGAVSPTVKRAPEGQVCLDSFITTDLRISRSFKLKGERITIEPALEWFNLFNVANYDLPDNKLSGVLDTTVGSINGTTAANRPNRAGGTGSFVLGAPRSWQLAVRVTF